MSPRNPGCEWTRWTLEGAEQLYPTCHDIAAHVPSRWPVADQEVTAGADVHCDESEQS
jgi:hypothetical protein